MNFLSKIIGDPNERELKKMQPLVDEINQLEKHYEGISDNDLKYKTEEFRLQLEEGAEPDDILTESFAAVREAAKRTLGQRHYDVQLLGGIALHEGQIAEMKTGEGKTLASTAPVYLNALSGKGVHVITVNDYLAQRDAVWMGQVYHALGLTIGVLTQGGSYCYDPEYAKEQEERLEELDEERDTLGSFKVEDAYLRPVSRAEAYKTDVTYGTNNEFGFDFLRDNLARKKEDRVQKPHHYAIIDEIDSVLIDEARTPLIISAPDNTSTDLYGTFARVVPRLKEGVDYNVDYKTRTVAITEDGIDKVEQALGIENIYDAAEGGGIQYVHALEQSLRAHAVFQNDKDYVVKDGEVVIIDEFTGRMMPGRRYSEGLHQAIEAKEGVEVKRESRTLASITFQNYFRMYDKLAGMTGTAVTSAEEFDRVYDLDVVVIPTNRPLIREELKDLVFRTEAGKFKALLRDIKERHERGQPLLIGTVSIERNEYLSRLLQKEGIDHEVLNAKNHEKEGQIIAQAGKKGAVTVATNMAGRGVDIILGGNPPDKDEAEAVREAGGLHVIGTERHEARRIDNQLRGRTGRQGDPGSSQFYLSFEDEIMRAFNPERVSALMERFNVPEDQPIESKIVTGSIESAQKRIEGMHFDSRKRLLEFDEVLNKHREGIYKLRNKILDAEEKELKETTVEYISSYFRKAAGHHMAADYKEDWNIEELFEDMRTVVPLDDAVHRELEAMRREQLEPKIAREKITDHIIATILAAHNEREHEAGAEAARAIERWTFLHVIDQHWTDHLDAMEHMRQSVRLRAYAQRDPLVEYKNEGLRMFNRLNEAIESAVVHTLFKVNLQASRHEEARQMRFQGAAKTAGVDFSNTAGQPRAKPEDPKHKDIGRNDPCYCGSGKKYKKCGLINAPEHKG